ncbi:MAG TPA: uroporphyrinogen-III synthase [Nocardioidaceae bacterium]
MTGRPLTGFRVGITSARKVEELTALLERRGAEVESAPAMAIEATCDVDLRAATETVIAVPPAVFVATTGLGLRRWFEAASAWGMLADLVAALGQAEIVARGPKAVGALRTHGLRELWSPPSECFEDVLAYLRGSLAGRRIVVQEHGRSLSVVANALRLQGGDVQVVSVYRCGPADDQAAMFRMVDLVAERKVDAVTFTSAPAAEILMDVAVAAGRRADVLEAFRSDVLAACVGPVTAAPFEMWGVPSVQPARSRLAAMVRTLEEELPSRRRGTEIAVRGHRLLMHGDRVCVDGTEARLSPAPLAVLRALAERPGHVVSRRDLMGHLPSGHAGSEHAVEVAVARLRSAVGPRLVQTVVKRGYRLPVT